MINLLPGETRKDMLFARKNTELRRWFIYLVSALVGVILIISAGLFYLTQTTKSFEEKTSAGKEALQAQNIDGTQKEIESISNNVKLTTQVLSREILFSKLLNQLGAVLPANAALSQLQIDKVQGAITIIAQARDINSATQVQLNLQDPKNKIFDKADIENISCDSDLKRVYPCTIQLRALFTKDNPYLYISPGVKS